MFLHVLYEATVGIPARIQQSHVIGEHAHHLCFLTESSKIGFPIRYMFMPLFFLFKMELETKYWSMCGETGVVTYCMQEFTLL